MRKSGALASYPGTSIRGQLARAGIDPTLADHYGDRMRAIMDIPQGRKEFGRGIGQLDVKAFTSAVDEFIEAVRREADNR